MCPITTRSQSEQRAPRGVLLRLAYLLSSWPMIAGLFLLALALGLWGFTLQYRREGLSPTVMNLIYRALLLFPLASGYIEGEAGWLPWQLEIARYLAPLVSLLPALKAGLYVFHDRLQLWDAVRRGGHVVVCGLDALSRTVAAAYLQAGQRVVIIAPEVGEEDAETLREQGAAVLAADPAEAATLARAGAAQARHILALCEEEQTNISVFAAASELAKDAQRRPLFSLDVSPQLYELARIREIAGAEDPLRLEFFDLYQRAARAMVDTPAPLIDMETGDISSHLLIAGLGSLGRNLAIEAARRWQWHRQAYPQAEPLRLTLVGPEAVELQQRLLALYPGMVADCRLEALPLELTSSLGSGGTAWEALLDRFPPQRVFLCPEAQQGLSMALSLLNRLQGRGVPIVVGVYQEAGLARLLAVSGQGALVDNLHLFGLLERVCAPALLEQGTHALLAQAIHEDYRQTRRRAQELGLEDDPAMADWERLADGYRQANWRAADHIGLKLAAMGWRILPLSTWEPPPFAMSEAEVERLAQLEHERWAQELRTEGWAYGPTRDPDQRINPYLVAWNELPEEIRQRNCQSARGFPNLMARAGFRLCRIDVTCVSVGEGMPRHGS